MKTVLDTCVLKLATLPNPANKSAVVVELCLREVLHAYVTPDMLGEYQRVLGDSPLLLEEIQEHLEREIFPIWGLSIEGSESDEPSQSTST